MRKNLSIRPSVRLLTGGAVALIGLLSAAPAMAHHPSAAKHPKLLLKASFQALAIPF